VFPYDFLVIILVSTREHLPTNGQLGEQMDRSVLSDIITTSSSLPKPAVPSEQIPNKKPITFVTRASHGC
jgi:hypothetical protein